MLVAAPPCPVHVVGKRIVDAAGRTVYTEPATARFRDSYSGPWTVAGEQDAYFTGWCPACGYGTVSLWVTRDGGRHFRRYRLPTLTGYEATAIRVAGDDVTITAASHLRIGPRTRTVTVEVRRR